MKSFKFLQKRTIKNYFEEISTFDLFYQLTYMAAVSAAGISRARTFQLARTLPSPPAQFFRKIHEVAENLRYNYPDAVRLVGEGAKSEETRSFLLRLSDALRSGEPLPGFLAREAEVMGERYGNDYARNLESLRKWGDAYTSVAVASTLIVIINMVSSMIYSMSPVTMMLMVMVALAASGGVAWVLFRSGPQEAQSTPLSTGSRDQRRIIKLCYILGPAAVVVTLAGWLVGLEKGWLLIADGLLILPIGWYSRLADKRINGNDKEISSFLRSLGGQASSRGTTLKDALTFLKIDSFPSLHEDIHRLDLRLKAYGKPKQCWNAFGLESGSNLVHQTISIFYEGVNVGGDPDKTGKLTSIFAMKTSMLRMQRRGVAGTFVGLMIVMHTVLAFLMIGLLVILEEFTNKLNAAMSTLNEGAQASAGLGLSGMFGFNAPQLQFMTIIVIGMVIILAFINSFAMVASEGGHLIKMSLYLSILLTLSGVCLLVVPPLMKSVI